LFIDLLKDSGVTRKRGPVIMPTALASKEKCIQKVFFKGNFKIDLILSQESKSVRCQKNKRFLLSNIQECIIGKDTL
jgi:hypothetical protein